MNLIRKIQQELENELSSQRFISLYQKLRDKYPLLDKFPSPIDLKTYLHQTEEPDYRTNDQVLLQLIKEYQTLSDPSSLASYLLIIFTPGLNKIYRTYSQRIKHFSLDQLDLWIEIRTAFLAIMANYDTQGKGSNRKVASKVLGRVRNRIRDWYKGISREETARQDFISAEEQPYSLHEDAEDAFNDLVRAGVINETDRYILVANLVYGNTLKEISGELKGISYEGVRQRKTRAEKAIFRYCEKEK